MELWPEGIALSAYARAWLFPEARVIFTKSYGEEATEDDANGLVDFFLWLEKLDGPSSLAGSEPPIVVHDWRSFRSVPAGARHVFAKRRKEITTVPERLVLALGMNPVLRMALRTVALGAQLVTRAVPLELVDDPTFALAEAGVEAPDALVHLRLREAWRQR